VRVFRPDDERVSRIPNVGLHMSALPTQTRSAVAATQREQVLAETELAHIVEGYDERSGRLVTFAQARRAEGGGASGHRPSTFSNVTGRSRTRTPVASYTALTTAAAAPTIPISPAPLAPIGLT
jgi:hypothetical protein